jgi:hypothetical protein
VSATDATADTLWREIVVTARETGWTGTGAIGHIEAATPDQVAALSPMLMKQTGAKQLPTVRRTIARVLSPILFYRQDAEAAIYVTVILTGLIVVVETTHWSVTSGK